MIFSLQNTTALRYTEKKKVAWITGGAYGIGFAIAEVLAKAGAKIAINCRSADKLEKAVEEFRSRGIDARGYVADVTDEAQVSVLVEQVQQDLGTIDILVNNAGIIKRIPMTQMSVKDFRQVVDIDLIGPFVCAKAVIPGIIRKGHGKIINVCSMMSELGRETVSAYAAAKSASTIGAMSGRVSTRSLPYTRIQPSESWSAGASGQTSAVQTGGQTENHHQNQCIRRRFPCRC